MAFAPVNYFELQAGAEELLPADLTPGQEVVLYVPGHWSDTSGRIQIVKVEKVTKTRLVLDNGVRLVIREGMITGKVEGSTFYTPTILTTDDAKLIEYRARNDRLEKRYAALVAAERFQRDVNVETAKRLIADVQAWLDVADPEED